MVALAGCIVSFTGRFDVTVLDAGDEEATQQEEAAEGPPAEEDAAQLLDVPLPGHVIANQQELAARGPPAHRDAAELPAILLPQHVIAPSSGIQAPDLGLSNILIESFVGSEDRAASQVPIAPSHTVLGTAQMGAFDAQAQILAQCQQNTKEIESVTTHHCGNAMGSTGGPPAARGPPRSLHRLAVDLRDLLRWAESLQRQKLRGRKKFTPQEQTLLEDLAGGKLHAAANDATRKSHWGRIKHRDGTFEDIAPHNGGSVRTVLDNVDPTSSDDEYQSLDEEEPNQSI